MKSTLYRVVLSGTVLIGTLLLPAMTTAQDQMRFRAMDRNRDGVITRAEWQGSDQSFRQQDRNGDGILSGDEVRVAQGADIVNVFALVDFDGNGEVTTQEWRRAFTQLDVNRDGLLTEDELWSRSTPPVLTRAFQAGRDRGLNDGRRAGREDRDQRGVWDLEGSGSSNRPMGDIAASWARATSTRPAISKDSGRDMRKGTGLAADLVARADQLPTRRPTNAWTLGDDDSRGTWGRQRAARCAARARSEGAGIMVHLVQEKPQ